MEINKIQVEQDDVIVLECDLEIMDMEMCENFCENFQSLYPNNPILFVPKSGVNIKIIKSPDRKNVSFDFPFR